MPLKLLLLVGLVGSGKTSFSLALCQHLQNWQRISQDDLGSRPACEAATRNALAQGADVVIDRCNFDKRQRETWLRIARQFQADVYCLELKTDLALCRTRIMNRQNHPTQVQGTFGTTVLDRQKAQYQPLLPIELAAIKKMYTLTITDNSVEWKQPLLEGVLQRLGIDVPH